MNNKHHIIKERFDIDITTANNTFKGAFELDKNAKFLLAIAITSDREDLMYYRGSQKIAVNDKELFPEKFESKMLQSGLNVPPDNRMVSVGTIPTGNGKIDVSYKDSNHVLAKFAPYRISIYTYSTANESER